MKCHDSRFRTAVPARLDRPVYPPTKNLCASVRSASSGRGISGGRGPPAAGNIAVFQGVASLVPLAVPAGTWSRPGRRSGVTLRARRNFVIEPPAPASPAPDRDRSGAAPPAASGRNGGRRKGCCVSFPRPPRIGLRLSGAARRGTHVSGYVMFCCAPPADGASCRSNGICSYNVLMPMSSNFLCSISAKKFGLGPEPGPRSGVSGALPQPLFHAQSGVQIGSACGH